MEKFTVSKNDSQQKLLNFIKKMYKNVPISVIYKWFRKKKIKVNGKIIKDTKYVLLENDLVVVYDFVLSFKKDNRINLEKIENLDIKYIDKNIIVVCKKFGQIVHDNSQYCLDNIVYNYLRINNLLNESDNSFKISHLHRLDKPTKGLIIYPINKTASIELYNNINKKNYIKKIYILRCENLKMQEGEIFGYIYYNETMKRSYFSLTKNNQNYKECSQKIKLINKEKFIYEVELLTGRKHQIRAICSYFKCPIVNDYRYGAKKIYNDIRIDLVAYKLIFNLKNETFNYLNKIDFEINKECLFDQQ